MGQPAIVNPQSSIPKRRYTASDRSRAAARRNVVKAREVWQRQRRQPGFRLSRAVLEAIHGGLLKASRWHLTDCSRRYASRFRNGLFAISLERSLAAAGETLDDYLGHVRRIVSAFTTNHDPPSTNGEPASVSDPSIVITLATALAQVSWRRLRAFRTHVERERLAVFRCFRQLAAEREAGGRALTSRRLVQFARDLHQALWPPDSRLSLHLRRLNRRFEALANRLLTELGLPLMKLRVRPSPVVDCAGTYSLAAALANPLQRPMRVRAALAPREARVKPPEQWHWEQSGARSQESQSDCRLADPASSVEDGGPATLDDFRALVERALGPNPGLEPGGPDPVPAGLAGAIWERLEFHQRHARRESERFNALLDDYLASLASIGERPSAIGNNLTELATGLAQVLRPDDDFGTDSAVLNGRVQVWIYLMLLGRHVPRGHIVPLQPAPPDTGGMVLEVLKLEKAGRQAEAERLFARADEMIEEWKRWQKLMSPESLGSEFGVRSSALRSSGPFVEGKPEPKATK